MWSSRVCGRLQRREECECDRTGASSAASISLIEAVRNLGIRLCHILLRGAYGSKARRAVDSPYSVEYALSFSGSVGRFFKWVV